MTKLRDRLREDARILRAGSGGFPTVANECDEAADLLDECETAFAFIAQAGCDCDECDKARYMLAKLRSDEQ